MRDRANVTLLKHLPLLKTIRVSLLSLQRAQYVITCTQSLCITWRYQMHHWAFILPYPQELCSLRHQVEHSDWPLGSTILLKSRPTWRKGVKGPSYSSPRTGDLLVVHLESHEQHRWNQCNWMTCGLCRGKHYILILKTWILALLSYFPSGYRTKVTQLTWALKVTLGK